MKIFLITLITFNSFCLDKGDSSSLEEKVNKIESTLLKNRKNLEGVERSINQKHEKYLQHVRVNKKLKILLDDYNVDLSREKLVLSKRIKSIKSKMIKAAMLDNDKLAIENQILAKILNKSLKKDLKSLEKVNSKIHSIESKISSFGSRVTRFENESMTISNNLRVMNAEKEKLAKSKEELYLAKDILEDEYLEFKANEEFEKIKQESEQKFISKTHLSNPIDDFLSARQLHKGLEFQVSESSGLKVIDDGEVVHSDILASFGRIIIVKHKNNLRSVYLGDYESNISLNTKVKKSQKLGNILPGMDSKIYFELRKKEKPLELANFYHLNSII